MRIKYKNRGRMYWASGILLMIHALMLMISCGTLNKQKIKSSQLETSQLVDKESRLNSISEDINDWQKQWLLEGVHSTALLYSDSIMIVRPDGGIELSKGHAIIRSEKLKKVATESDFSSKRAESTENVQFKHEQKQVGNEQFLSKKEQSLIVNLFKMGFILLIFTWLYSKLKGVKN